MARGSQNVKAICPNQGFSSSEVSMMVAYEKSALTAEDSSFPWDVS